MPWSASRDKLKGLVEVDETYLSITDRKNPATCRAQEQHHQSVDGHGGGDRGAQGFGRIRLRRIDRDAATHVIPFVQEVVEPGAQVRTDGSAAYRALGELGYTHQRTVMLGSGVPAHVPWRECTGSPSLVQRWVLGTHHGSVQPDHLDAYPMNSCSASTWRTSSSRGMLVLPLAAASGGHAASDVWGCREQEHRGEAIGYHCWMKSQYQWGCWS